MILFTSGSPVIPVLLSQFQGVFVLKNIILVEFYLLGIGLYPLKQLYGVKTESRVVQTVHSKYYVIQIYWYLSLADGHIPQPGDV